MLIRATAVLTTYLVVLCSYDGSSRMMTKGGKAFPKVAKPDSINIGHVDLDYKYINTQNKKTHNVHYIVLAKMLL